MGEGGAVLAGREGGSGGCMIGLWEINTREGEGRMSSCMTGLREFKTRDVLVAWLMT